MRNISLGERIRVRRKEVGLTAEELARRVGIDRTYLSKIERHNFLSSPEVFKNINKILDLGPEFRKRYIQKKYPDFGEVLKGVLDEGSNKLYIARGNKDLANLPPGAHEINLKLISLLTSGKEENTYPVVAELLKEYNPSQADNNALINRIVKQLKQMQKESKDRLKAFQKKEVDLISLILNPV